MFTAGYNTAWGSLLEKQHPCQSKQQGGMCPPGDTAGGRGGLLLAPHLYCLWVDARKDQTSGTGTQILLSSMHGAGAGSTHGPNAVLSPCCRAAGSLCDKPDQHGGWQ